MTIVALDLGGTKLSAALLVDRTIRHRTVAPTAARQGPAAVTDQMVRLVQDLPGWEQAERLAVAATGRVHGGRVSALNLSTMPGWTDVPLQEELSRRVGRPVTVLNDADAAAYGEAHLGAGQGLASMMFVTVSTGVGAGIVLNGQLLQSASGVHADFGYLRAGNGSSGHGDREDETVEDGAGEDGNTIEALSGGRALERWTRRHGGTGGAAQLIGWAAGDARAEARLQLAVTTLIRGFGDVRVMTGVEDVVIGGSVGLNPEFFRRLEVCALDQPDLYRVRLRAAVLGADAGLHGAALFTQRERSR
ncbi:ROK family protein [Deinococcus altitudinis]|uniref:ROK family protein n=1 Tax=Deinococcus altitudinis TaxID=468914 RepID=UPI00389269C9